MKYLLFADIHSNYDALANVLEFTEDLDYEKLVILGDLVGYGASPNEVIERLRGIDSVIAIRGNHDKVCAGIEDGNNFNEAAYAAAYWTRKHLKKGNLGFLASLPAGPVEIEKDVLISHGSPIDEDAYIFNEYDAMVIFQATDWDVIFFGHTHFPVIYGYHPDTGLINVEVPAGARYEVFLEKGVRYLINPGSIGQPRDGNSDSSFILFDRSLGRLVVYRVSYDYHETQRKMMEAKLPIVLALRLETGN